MKPFAFTNAKSYNVIDRCGNTGVDHQLYEKAGKKSFRNYKNEKYEFIVPKNEAKIATFSEKLKENPFKDRYSLDEIDCMIREWLIKERATIMQMFKSSDVTYGNYITKESLLKILFNCCRHIKVDQFYKLLERYNLNLKSVISFNQFEKAFSAPPLGQFKPPVLFHGMGSQFKVTSSLAMQLTRQAALDKDFNLRSLLPEICFKDKKLVLMPQFRDALSCIKINMCDEDFMRLWNRIDTNGVGSVPLKKLLELLNLQDDGTPMCGIRENAVLPKLKKSSKPYIYKCPLKYTNCYALTNKGKLPDVKAGGVSFPINRPTCWKPHGPGGTNNYPFGQGSQFAEGLDFVRKRRPKFHSIVNTLAYIFSEPYKSMMITFERFDKSKNGFVLLCDGLKILCEYDFNIELPTLENFLTAHSCLDLHKGMNYHKLLNHVTDKREANRIIDKIILSQNQASGIRSLHTMSLEEVEQMFYKILHKDYIDFLIMLRKSSTDSKLILENELLNIIETILGYKMTEDQLEDLRDELDYNLEIGDEQNRLVNFKDFLNKFTRPIEVCRFRTNPDLTEKSEIWKRKYWRGNTVYDPFRGASFVCRLVLNTLRNRFHQMDRVYKGSNDSSEEKISKEILMELLNDEKCNLTPPEMDVIWQIVEQHPDYSKLKYRQILKYLLMNLEKKAKEFPVEIRRKKLSEMPDNNLQIISKFKQAYRKEKADKWAECRHKIRMSQQKIQFQPDEKMKQETIQKMLSKMQQIWNMFKQQLRKHDIMGTTTLELYVMKKLLIQHEFGLSKKEIENLLYSFDKNKDGRFHYIDFLMEFSELNLTSPDQEVPILHFDRTKHYFMNKKTGKPITVTDTYKEIRKALIAKWGNLIDSFRKIDSEKVGKITKFQLNKILVESGIALNEDDLHHFFSSFDTDLDGKIDYIEFIEQLLDVFKSNKV